MHISDLQVQAKEQEDKKHILHEVLSEQRDDLSLLCSIVEYLKSQKSVRLDDEDTKKYIEKMEALKSRQTNRYEVIDQFINENLKEIKKGHTGLQVVVVFAKEVRKLESGLRTLMLFTSDVIEMLKLNATVEDRVDDRLYYFDKRSSALETEIIVLQQNIAIH